MQFAAGYVFGAVAGFLLSFCGIMAGSAIAFWIGARLGRPALQRVLGKAALERLDRAVASERSRAALFALFLIPGAPKDAMCYGSGLAGFGFLEFMLLSGLGRAPALFYSALLGAQLQARDPWILAWTAVTGCTAALLVWRYRRRFQSL